MIYMISTLELLNIMAKPAFRTQFYNKCVEYLKRRDKKIHEIENNAYILEPLRLWLIGNPHIFLYLSDTIPKDPCFYRKLELSSKGYKNLEKQVGKTGNYFIISEQKLNLELVANNYANICVLLGIKSLEILEYQNDVTNYDNSFTNSLTTSEKERVMVINDYALNVLGNIVSNKVELIYVAAGDNYNSVQEFKKKVRNYKYHLLFKDENHIFEAVADPNYHYHYLGLKFVSLDMLATNLKKISSSESLASLLLLEINNKFFTKICFPNLTVRHGVASVFSDKLIDIKLKKILNILKERNIIMTYDELKDKIPKCRDKAFEIYESRPQRNDVTNGVIAYHNDVMKYYIDNAFDKEKLLDIGAGPLRQVEFYEKIGFKELVAIEPSQSSIETGLERYKNRCKKLKLVFIEGVGDEPWLNNNNYKPIIDKKLYKSVLFKFTIHYMIRNLDILLDNLKMVVDKGCTIVISCIDGSKLVNNMKNGKYEIVNRVEGEEPVLLYGVYDFPSEYDTENYKQIMIYFNGVYGVDNGSIEYVVNIDYLVSKFKEIGFENTFSKNFADIDIKELKSLLNKFNNAQRRISELHHLLIFKN